MGRSRPRKRQGLVLAAQWGWVLNIGEGSVGRRLLLDRVVQGKGVSGGSLVSPITLSQGQAESWGLQWGRKGFVLQSHCRTMPRQTYGPSNTSWVSVSLPCSFLLSQSPPREPDLTPRHQCASERLRGRMGMGSQASWVLLWCLGHMGCSPCALSSHFCSRDGAACGTAGGSV